MFREIQNLRQERDGGRRRWFEADGIELVVWLAEGDRVTGFQICYDLGHGEHALTWRAGAGFAHSEVDAGDSTPLKNETPVLIPRGRAPWAEIVRGFDARSTTLDAALRNFVREKLVAQAG